MISQINERKFTEMDYSKRYCSSRFRFKKKVLFFIGQLILFCLFQLFIREVTVVQAQFEGMFEVSSLIEKESRAYRGNAKSNAARRKKGGSGGGGGGGSSSAGQMRSKMTRTQILSKNAREIVNNMDRYHLWWTGPPDTNTFQPIR
jgi:uncharacterized membrane protein YgcG